MSNKYGLRSMSRSSKPQPKQNFKFRVSFLGVGGNTYPNQIELTKNVVDCGLPKFTQNSINVHVYNSTYSILDKHMYDPITITLRNDVGNEVARIVDHQLAKQANSYSQEVAPAAGMTKFQLKIEQVDGGGAISDTNMSDNGVILSTWHLTGCWFTSVDWGNLNYSDSQSNNVVLTIKYDNAFQTLLGYMGVKKGDPQGWANSVHISPTTNIYDILGDSAV